MSPCSHVVEANQYHIKLDYSGLFSVMAGFLTHILNTSRFLVMLAFITFSYCIFPVCREENGLLKTVVNERGDSVTGTPIFWQAVSFPLSLPEI